MTEPNQYAPRKCTWCGKMFQPRGSSATCGMACYQSEYWRIQQRLNDEALVAVRKMAGDWRGKYTSGRFQRATPQRAAAMVNKLLRS